MQPKIVDIADRKLIGMRIKTSYELNNCPHFKILSDQYEPDDPNAEEQIWIPIKESTRLKM